MQLPRFVGISAVLAAMSIATVVSCGGGSSGGNPVDAAGVHDASGSGAIDAPGSGSGSNVADGIGKTCTPGSTPQGDCPTGFTCLSLQGAAGAWCSKPCTAGSGDTCATGYTGPGKASCLLQVSAGSGSGSAQSFCDVFCEDDTGTHQICSAATCNDTCPGALSCTAAVHDNNGSAVAKACD